MKRLASSILATVWVAVLSLCASPAAWAVRAIDTPKASPNGFFANEPTIVAVTAQVAVDPNLIPTSVRLVRVNDQGQAIAVLAAMYDDGTRGDALLGDGTFTAQIILNEAQPGYVGLAVTAAYRGTLLRTQSTAIFVPVARRPTDVEVQQSFQAIDGGAAFFAARSAQLGADQARLDLIDYLKAQPGVADAQISADGATISILFTSGLQGAISTFPTGTRGSGTKAVSRYLLAFLQASSTASTVTYPSTAKAIVLAPFFDQFSPYDESNDIANKLSATCAGPTTPLYNEAVTVDVMKTLRQYGVISIATHGMVNGNQVALATREPATLLSYFTYVLDWATGRLIPSTAGGVMVWYITPRFVTTYAGGLPASIAYLGACDSSLNSSMSDSLLAAGATAVFGYNGLVRSDFASSTGIAVFDTLSNLSLDPGERTVAKAFANVSGLTDQTYGSQLTLSSPVGGNVALANELVINGGFETGDLTGWVADRELGYDTASIDDHTAGTYSARIGRWDQPYRQGGCFLCGPIPGTEPFGVDYIYQDIDLPFDSSKLTLSFDYNIVTYDGAAYDWFDMKILDAASGALLAQPVAREGGIIQGSIYNWGLFYTTGWKSKSVDLTPYEGRKVRVMFSVTQDGFGDQTAVYIDRVSIKCE